MSLDPTATVAETLTGGRGDTVTIGGQAKHVVGYMKDFLFSPEQARTPVGVLSGGERNRLMLARALAQPSNLLVLDEPTNDLDLETLDLLQEMITDYSGTVILVSHDRDFLDRTASSVLVSEGEGVWIEYAGGYTDMVNQRGQGVQARVVAEGRQAEKCREIPARRRLSFQAQDELQRAARSQDAAGANGRPSRRRSRRLQEIMADPLLYARDPERFQKASAALAALAGRIRCRGRSLARTRNAQGRTRRVGRKARRRRKAMSAFRSARPSARWRRTSNGRPCPSSRCGSCRRSARNGVFASPCADRFHGALFGDAGIADAALGDGLARPAVLVLVGDRSRADDRAGAEGAGSAPRGRSASGSRRSCRRPHSGLPKRLPLRLESRGRCSLPPSHASPSSSGVTAIGREGRGGLRLEEAEALRQVPSGMRFRSETSLTRTTSRIAAPASSRLAPIGTSPVIDGDLRLEIDAVRLVRRPGSGRAGRGRQSEPP